jgi:hypothetical protein
MDCIYCSYIEVEEAAVGLCKCGAGICRRHVFEQFAAPAVIETIGPVGRTKPPTERRLLCPACIESVARPAYQFRVVA